MTSKTGANVSIAIGTSSTWGTADTIGTGDKAIHTSFTHNKNPEELTITGIGSGAEMASDSAQGATTPTISGTVPMHYNDAIGQVIASFFQGESITGNAASGYTHSFVHGGFNQKYLTVAATPLAQSVLEMATGAVTRLQTTFDNPPNYASLSYDVIGNDIKYTGTTNSYATVEAATVANTKKVFAKAADTVVISGTTFPVTSVDVVLTKEQASAREMKGSDGNGAPIPVGDPPFQGTVTVTFKEWADHTFFSGAAADTTYTMITTHTGDTISGASNAYQFQWRFPAMKIITQPQSDITTGAVNPLTVTFKCIYASSLPSGMYSLYPHCTLRNDRSTIYFT